MQTQMLPYPYSLSCPPFVDVSNTGTTTTATSSPDGTPSPPAYMTAFYDSMLAAAAVSTNSSVTSPTLQHLKSMQYGTSFKPPAFASSTVTSTKTANPTGCHLASRRPSGNTSFTIEAILGLSKCADELDNNKISSKDSGLGSITLSDRRRHDRLISSNPYISASTLSPDSTAKENKPLKSQSLQHQHIKDSSFGRDQNRSGVGSQNKPNPNNNGKTKRVRTIFTPEQLERLESEFERQQYMVGPERLYLASALNLTEAQVKVWFQNRRIKWRKQHLEMQQARLAQIRQEAEGESDSESPALSEAPNGHWGELLENQ